VQEDSDKDRDELPPEVLERVQRDQVARAAVQASYPRLFASLRRCLFEHDPIGINFESNTDEYDPEVGTIIARLKTCASEADVLEVVYEEFVNWFGEDTAGRKSKYKKVAKEIWALWMRERHGRTTDRGVPDGSGSPEAGC
jgi:hypothetical protein